MKESYPIRMVLIALAIPLIFLVTGCGGNDPADPGGGGATTEGWETLFPKPQGNTLNDVHMIDLRTAVAVGEGGTIMRTTTGGLNWKVIRSSNRFDMLLCVSLAEGFGLAGGVDGTLLMTRNGGETWLETDPGISGLSSTSIQGVHALDAMTAVAVCANGLFLRTDDGGVSWSGHVIDDILGDVSFFNADTGIVINPYGSALWTTDGGATWVPKDVPPGLNFTSAVMTSATSAIVSWSDYDLKIAGLQIGGVITTTDGGASWQSVQVSGDSPIFSLTMSSPSVGCATSGNIVHRTQDGGRSWTRSGNLEYRVNSLSSAKEGAALAVGNSGAILNSTDGGSSWTPRYRTFHSEFGIPWLNTAWFFGPEVGLVGSQYDGVFRTTDGGRSWTQTKPSGQTLFFHFFDETTGLTSNHQEQGVSRTTDGGLTWSSVAVGATLLGVHFADFQIGLGTGPSGTVRKSTDGGLTWTAPVVSPTHYQLGKPFLVSSRIFLVIGQGGTLFRSNNGGATSWDAINLGNANHRDIDFNPDRSIGLLVGANFSNDPIRGLASILRSTDAGATWQDHSPVARGLAAVHFADAQTAYAVGQGGEIIKSTDGGINWTQQESPFSGLLTEVFFTNPGTGMALGQGGAILRTETGGE